MPDTDPCPTVAVWWLPLDMKAALLADLGGLLNAEERERAARFAFPGLRNRFVAARAQLREVLATATGRDARGLVFTVGPHGKPALESGEVEFNLSHSGGAGIVAVAPAGCPVGVDLECVERKTNIAGVAERFFPREDFETISTLTEREARQFFFRHWTAREAVMKATGLGMQLGPQNIRVRIEGEAGSALTGEAPDAAPQGASMMRRLLRPFRSVADDDKSGKREPAARAEALNQWHLTLLRDDYEIVAALATPLPVRVEQHGAL